MSASADISVMSLAWSPSPISCVSPVSGEISTTELPLRFSCVRFFMSASADISEILLPLSPSSISCVSFARGGNVRDTVVPKVEGC